MKNINKVINLSESLNKLLDKSNCVSLFNAKDSNTIILYYKKHKKFMIFH
jgi:hypothetical protein